MANDAWRSISKLQSARDCWRKVINGKSPLACHFWNEVDCERLVVSFMMISGLIICLTECRSSFTCAHSHIHEKLRGRDLCVWHEEMMLTEAQLFSDIVGLSEGFGADFCMRGMLTWRNKTPRHRLNV